MFVIHFVLYLAWSIALIGQFPKTLGQARVFQFPESTTGGVTCYWPVDHVVNQLKNTNMTSWT